MAKLPIWPQGSAPVISLASRFICKDQRLMQKAPIQVSGKPWEQEEPLVTVVVNAHG
jgi:hypothetical protein